MSHATQLAKPLVVPVSVPLSQTDKLRLMRAYRTTSFTVAQQRLQLDLLDLAKARLDYGQLGLDGDQLVEEEQAAALRPMGAALTEEEEERLALDHAAANLPNLDDDYFDPNEIFGWSEPILDENEVM